MPEPSKASEVFDQLVAAISSQNVSAIAHLLADDHVFVDALGNTMQGASTMEGAWRGYFTMCPDYWIRPAHVLAEGDLVLAAGEAGGTIDGQPWRTPAAWKAVIRGGQVAEWRVFADNKPVYEILARRQKQ
jgi:ketosteroid isomerase-like protein